MALPPPQSRPPAPAPPARARARCGPPPAWQAPRKRRGPDPKPAVFARPAVGPDRSESQFRRVGIAIQRHGLLACRGDPLSEGAGLRAGVPVGGSRRRASREIGPRGAIPACGIWTARRPEHTGQNTLRLAPALATEHRLSGTRTHRPPWSRPKPAPKPAPARAAEWPRGRRARPNLRRPALPSSSRAHPCCRGTPTRQCAAQGPRGCL